MSVQEESPVLFVFISVIISYYPSIILYKFFDKFLYNNCEKILSDPISIPCIAVWYIIINCVLLFPIGYIVSLFINI
jgi:hypothetical protein